MSSHKVILMDLSTDIHIHEDVRINNGKTADAYLYSYLYEIKDTSAGSISIWILRDAGR